MPPAASRLAICLALALIGSCPSAGQMIARLPDPADAASSSDLVGIYRDARRHDPQFQAAVAERDVNLQTANQSLTQYLPSASYQMTSVPTENTTRQIVQLTQPIASLDRYAAFKQRGPRRNFAEATFGVADQKLATRLLTEVGNYIKAVESIRLSTAKIDALQQQSARADKLYKAGLGTVTDARDIEVRYQQAVADRYLLESEQLAAAARVASITGSAVKPGDFSLVRQQGTIRLQPLPLYFDQQEGGNPTIAVARATERIGKLEALRAKGALLPTVGLSAVYTRTQGRADRYVGVSVLAPLAPAGYFQVRSASAAAKRAFEQRRQAEQEAHVDLERLYALVEGGQKALVASAGAISAAELSVAANTKSYEGGVRTSVDVVNAIQTLYQVKSDYVGTTVQVSNNLLALLLLSGTPTEEALAITQKFLFGN